jgi:hypothetical protein
MLLYVGTVFITLVLFALSMNIAEHYGWANTV